MLEPVRFDCPYCGEPVDASVDCSAGDQDYYEDCPVCCRPMAIRARQSPNGSIVVTARREDD
jgi:hypothetical protein